LLFPSLQQLELIGLEVPKAELPSLVSALSWALELTEIALRSSSVIEQAEGGPFYSEASRSFRHGIRSLGAEVLVETIVKEARQRGLLQRVRVRLGPLPFPSDYPS
jgi:hypothetical protein